MNSYEFIKNILTDHCGNSNKITAKEISRLLQIHDNEACTRTRSLILAAAKLYSLPLAADNHGYYLIKNQAEYEAYMQNLERRIDGIEARKCLITEIYKKKIV